MAINLGETVMHHQGHPYTLRLTLGDLKHLEPTVGKSYAVLQELLGRSIGVRELETIISRALLRADPRPDKTEIRDMLKDLPQVRMLKAAAALYGQLLISDEEEDAKADEETDGEDEEAKQEEKDPLSSGTAA